MQKDRPLARWGAKKSNFKQLASIAQKYLSFPPSSVESERLFSCGGQVHSPQRNRLPPETGEMLMFYITTCVFTILNTKHSLLTCY